GRTLSNSKFHVPNPTQASLNINGDLTVNSASDNHSLFSFWRNPVNFGTGQDAKPDYLTPDTSLITTVVNPANKAKIAPGTSGLVNGVTITNSSTSKWVYVFTPGRYTSSIVIPAAGDNLNNSVYILLNGVYYLSFRADITIVGVYVLNTSNRLLEFLVSTFICFICIPTTFDGSNLIV